jgi:hypothetical protein
MLVLTATEDLRPLDDWTLKAKINVKDTGEAEKSEATGATLNHIKPFRLGNALERALFN